MVRQTFIDLYNDGLYHYPLIISMNRCNEIVILLKIDLEEYPFLIKYLISS